MKNLPLTDMHWDDGRPMASRTLTEEERKAGGFPQDGNTICLRKTSGNTPPAPAP